MKKLVVTHQTGYWRGYKLKEYLSWCPNCKQHTPDDIGACANCYKVKPQPAKAWNWKPKSKQSTPPRLRKQPDGELPIGYLDWRQR